LQKKRDELRDLLSMSNGDAVSLMSDLSAVQDEHGKALDDTAAKMDNLKMKLDGMESMMRLCNMNLKSLKDLHIKDSKELVSRIKSVGGAPKTKEEEEEEEEEDVAPMAAPSSKGLWGGVGAMGARKTKFTRPRRSSKLG